PKGGFPGFFFISENAVLPSGSSIFGGPQNVYQVGEAATWIHGRHAVRFGGSYIHLRDKPSFGAFQNAQAGVTTATGLVHRGLNGYTFAIAPQGNFRGQTVNPPIGPPSFERHFHYNEPALFIQDTWKLTPRLTITPGLRWEYFGVLHSTG